VSRIFSIGDALTPTGVVAIGIEGTSVAGTIGQKGGGGVYVDFDNKTAGTYVKSGHGIAGNDKDVAGGAELQRAISVDYATSIENFRGTSIESGGSIGPLGVDYSIIEGQGMGTIGFDIGQGGGASVMKVQTEVISHWKF